VAAAVAGAQPGGVGEADASAVCCGTGDGGRAEDPLTRPVRCADLADPRIHAPPPRWGRGGGGWPVPARERERGAFTSPPPWWGSMDAGVGERAEGPPPGEGVLPSPAVAVAPVRSNTNPPADDPFPIRRVRVTEDQLPDALK